MQNKKKKYNTHLDRGPTFVGYRPTVYKDKKKYNDKLKCRKGKSMIIKKAVKSSAIKEVAYEDEKKILAITFNSGGTYDYFDVPPEKFEGLVNAPSVGKYFHEFIKQYAYVNAKIWE